MNRYGKTRILAEHIKNLVIEGKSVLLVSQRGNREFKLKDVTPKTKEIEHHDTNCNFVQSWLR